MEFTVLQIIILLFVISICLYTLTDRIMRCIEHCSTAKAYSLLRQSEVTLKLEDFADLIKKTVKDEMNSSMIYGGMHDSQKQ